MQFLKTSAAAPNQSMFGGLFADGVLRLRLEGQLDHQVPDPNCSGFATS